MKFLSMIPALGRRLFEPVEPVLDGGDWRRDPLAHPVLSGMSARELADLPFNRCERLPQDGSRGFSACG